MCLFVAFAYFVHEIMKQYLNQQIYLYSIFCFHLVQKKKTYLLCNVKMWLWAAQADQDFRCPFTESFLACVGQIQQTTNL